jgi:parvulin-like peptidyl-prolyl isomerase
VIRASRLLVPLVATALVLSGCGSDVPRGAAATVDGVVIARADLEDWVRQATTANPSIDATTLQRDLLGRAIQAQVVAVVLAERGLVVEEAGIEAVRAAIADEIGGLDELAVTLDQVGFAQDFFTSVFLFVEAAVDVIVASLIAGQVSETRTSRHILVDTAEEAAEIVALLRDGADFAELARERSVDPGSGPSGGELGAQRRGTFVPEFDEAVWSARLNVVLDPVQSQFGFHIIEVTASERVNAEDLAIDQQRGLVMDELDAILGDALDRVDVKVDRRIGVWDVQTGTVSAADTSR